MRAVAGDKGGGGQGNEGSDEGQRKGGCDDDGRWSDDEGWGSKGGGDWGRM